MPRKVKSILKWLAFVYVGAILAFAVSSYKGLGRAERTRPLLIPEEGVKLPNPTDYKEEGAKSPKYQDARKTFLDAGYVLYEKGEILTGELLDKFIADGVKVVNLHSRANIKNFAAKSLKSADTIKTPTGEIIVEQGALLTEDALLKMALTYDERDKDMQKLMVRGAAQLMGFDLTLVFAGLNFLILVVGLYGFIWEPVMKLLDDRARAITEDIDSARSKREEANLIKEQHDSKLKELREKSDEIINEAKKDGETEKSNLLDAAREEARLIAERRETALAAETENARKGLALELGNLSCKLASQILKRSVTQEDHNKLIEEFTAKLEQDARGEA